MDSLHDELESAQEQIDDCERAIAGQQQLIRELEDEGKKAEHAIKMLDTLLEALKYRRAIHDELLAGQSGAA
jgi:chromosome segregation ATPase